MLSTKVKTKLKAIVGPEDFIEAKEDLLAYSYDSFVKEMIPDIALLP